MRFSGKRVVVTGAASGIGRATARQFAAEGAEVTVADINEAGLAETAGMIGREVHVVPYDAADWDSCRALIASAAARGGIDVLANVAGMLAWTVALIAPAGLEQLLSVVADPATDPDDRAALLAVGGVQQVPAA